MREAHVDETVLTSLPGLLKNMAANDSIRRNQSAGRVANILLENKQHFARPRSIRSLIEALHGYSISPRYAASRDGNWSGHIDCSCLPLNMDQIDDLTEALAKGYGFHAIYVPPEVAAERERSEDFDLRVYTPSLLAYPYLRIKVIDRTPMQLQVIKQRIWSELVPNKKISCSDLLQRVDKLTLPLLVNLKSALQQLICASMTPNECESAILAVLDRILEASTLTLEEEEILWLAIAGKPSTIVVYGMHE